MKPYYQDEWVTIYNCRCEDILGELPKVDLVLTDPPYGINVGHMGMGEGKKATRFKNFSWDDSLINWGLLWELLTIGEKAICWGGNYYPVPPSGCWLSWDKIQEFSGADFELAWTNLKHPSKVFRKSRVEAYGNLDKKHPTQKPLDLFKWCIEQSGEPQTILDPFAGSCTTGRAAKDLGRKCICIELEEKYAEIGAHRMCQQVMDLS